MSHEEPKEDALLSALLREVDTTPALPVSFTAKVMAAVDMEAAEQALVYEPLLSHQAWRGIVLASGVLLVVSGLLSVLPFYLELVNSNEASSATWLTRVTLVQPARNAAPNPMGSHLLTAGGICLGYWLFDKWHSTHRQQQLAAKHRN